MRRISFLILAATGCVRGGQYVLPVPPEDRASAKAEAKAMRQMGIDVLQKLVDRDPSRNVCISPLSIQTALTMLRMGARGETEAELARALHQGTWAHSAQAFQQLMFSLAPLEQSGKLYLANSLWLASGEGVQDGFTDESEVFFRAEVARTTFPNPGLSKINAWVKRKTDGKIGRIFERLSPETVAVLVNAVYFKDAWAAPFDPAKTKNLPFQLQGGKSVDVPTMQGKIPCSVAYGDWGLGIRLPYASRLELAVLIPDSAVGDFSTIWPQMESILDQRRIGGQYAVGLPKWKAASDLDLIPVLRALGVKRAFDPGLADFSGIARTPMVVDQARHKTAFTVDEKGAEAAASTGIGLSKSPPTRIQINRPFLYAILDELGTPLFLGIVNDPRG